MAKRNLKLFKKTSSQPEVVDQAPAHLENQASDDYTPATIDGYDTQYISFAISHSR